jgi:hypothetical protein
MNSIVMMTFSMIFCRGIFISRMGFVAAALYPSIPPPN